MFRFLTTKNPVVKFLFGVRVISKEDLVNYKMFLSKQDLVYLQQDICWTFVKDEWDYEIIVSEKNGEIQGSVLVLIRKIPILNKTLLYAPRGPVIGKGYNRKKVLNDLLFGIKTLAEQENAFLFKADPAFSIEDKEIQQLVKEFNIITNDNQNKFSGVQPQVISVLDIENKTEEEIMSGFESKTRYNIRLAERKGVSVREGTVKDLETFYELMLETAERQNFVPRTFTYFYNLITETNIFEKNVKLYVAEYQGIILSAGIYVYYGNQMEYLYGVNSNIYRNVMASYLLQWALIKKALKLGLKQFNFGGISGDLEDKESPLYGLYRFKKGFGTHTVTYCPEWNIVFKPFSYFTFNIMNKIRKKIKH